MIIAIDCDGTITENDKPYPQVGTIKPEAIPVLKKLMERHTCCLWTCRTGEHLQMAIDALKEHGIVFKWVNDSPVTDTRRKIIADVYIDDRAFGGITDWDVIEEYLC